MSSDPLGRRAKVATIGEEVLLDVLGRGMTGDVVVRLKRRGERPPKDSRVVAVAPDFCRRAVTVLIESDEFDPVPAGEMTPNLQYPIEWHAFEVDILKARTKLHAIRNEAVQKGGRTLVSEQAINEVLQILGAGK